MIARTYYVEMPNPEGGDVALDIVVELPGSQSEPIDSGNSPAGWVGSGGSYYEVRGRPLRLPVQVGDAGFVPRFNLGWSLSVVPVGTGAEQQFLPGVQISESLQASLNATPLTDPSYGPVIRLSGTAGDVSGLVYTVHLLVMEAKDEDRTSTGT